MTGRGLLEPVSAYSLVADALGVSPEALNDPKRVTHKRLKDLATNGSNGVPSNSDLSSFKNTADFLRAALQIVLPQEGSSLPQPNIAEQPEDDVVLQNPLPVPDVDVNETLERLTEEVRRVDEDSSSPPSLSQDEMRNLVVTAETCALSPTPTKPISQPLSLPHPKSTTP